MLWHCSASQADHVPCAGCGACCTDGPAGPFCVETPPDVCVLNLGGNPQDIGTDCHDFNGNGEADACEPAFPLCEPGEDHLSCAGFCPGPIACNPTKIRLTLSPFAVEILECGCAVGCYIDMGFGATPPCIGSCPAGTDCRRIENNYGNIVDYECRCEPSGACCRSNNSCAEMTQAECVAEGGSYLGDNSTCSGVVGACCYDGDGDGLSDQCASLDMACCSALGGSFQGAGTMCQGTGACCFGITGGGCVEVDGICCDDFLGTFRGVGSVCLGDRNQNGRDDVCENGPGLCHPSPDGLSCEGFCNPNEFCTPKVVRLEPTGTYRVVECDCLPTIPNQCMLEFNPAIGTPFCSGVCLFGGCELITRGYLDGSVDYFCECLEVPNSCLPTDIGDSCIGVCQSNIDACMPKAIRIAQTDPPMALSCECAPPDSCRPIVDPVGPSGCFGGCPSANDCNSVDLPSPDGSVSHHCVCVSPTPEACCIPESAVTCAVRPVAECLELGGTPQGPGSNCEGFEACCLPDGTCALIDRLCCDDIGGTPLGAGTECLGTGACCLDIDDGPVQYDTCMNADKACCEAAGGVFHGVGTSCEIEACCLPNGLCADLDRRCCALSGGTPLGAGTQCLGGGACCYDIDDGPFQYDTCLDEDKTCCEASGGWFQGVGTSCDSQACCLPTGECQVLDSDCCVSSGGTPQGSGTVCLGDNNGNGQDDACEPQPCHPTPDGLQCVGTCNPNEFCAPSKIQREIDGTFRITECDCYSTFDPNICRVELFSPGPLPPQGVVCAGTCTFLPLTCTLITTGNLTGTVDYECQCLDIIPFCQPTPDQSACIGPCFDNVSACVPKTIVRDPTDPTSVPIAADCTCVDPGSCRPFVPPPGAGRFCLDGCPQALGLECNLKFSDVDGDRRPDEYACNCEPACQTDRDCDDDYVCTCDECVQGVCLNKMVEFGNVNCRGPVLPNLDDVLCVIAGFGHFDSCPNADLAPMCVGNNIINLDDILAVMRGFAGQDPCGCQP